MSGPLDLEALLRRLHLPTVRRLYASLEERAESEEMSYRDYLATLMAEEVGHRAQTRIERSVRKAKFPFLKTIEQFDFTFQTSVRLSMLGSFLGPELVSEGRSAIFFGPTGTGKTSLAIAISYRAIQNGFEALFINANELLERLSLAGRSDRLEEALFEYVDPDVLLIDEVGYLTHRADAANVLFHVVNERHLKRRPTLFTTNKPVAAWGQVLHDPDLAEAILDRVLEHGRLIELRGPSYRTRHLRREPRAGRGEAAPRSQAEPSPDPRRDDARWPIFSGKGGQEFPEPTIVSRTRAPRPAGGSRTESDGRA
jgi:DNA replication protein DnaC